MSNSVIRINGKIDKLLKVQEDGPTIILFKSEDDSLFKLKSSIIMVEVTRRQWQKFKDHPNVLELYFTITGKFEIRKKDDKPFLYVKSISIERLKAKGQKNKLQEFENVNKEYERQIEIDKREMKEIEEKRRIQRKKELEDQKEDKFWYEKIEENKFIEIDISKVKLTNEIHLNSIVPIYNIKRINRIKRVSPIAVRQIDSSEEYELITGLKSFILAKLLSLKVKAYITDLDRDTFKEKYSLEK